MMLLILALGVALWAYSHLMKRVTPGFRAGLGDQNGKLVATALSLIALAVMIWAYRAAPVIMVWTPPAFMQHINNTMMIIAVILVNLGHSRGVMRTKMRHPMLTSVKVWALAHLLVNGDLASIILFGGMMAWAVVDVIMINKMTTWTRPAAGPVRNDILYILASAVLFLVIVMIHTYLGYPPLPGGM